LGIITTPLICLGIITVLIFGDYYVAFWGLLLCSISGIIQATRINQPTTTMKHRGEPLNCKQRVAVTVICHATAVTWITIDKPV
jgi:hypothetical protein